MHFLAFFLFLLPYIFAAPYPTTTCTQEVTNTTAIAIATTSTIAVSSSLPVAISTPTPIANLPALTAGVSPPTCSPNTSSTNPNCPRSTSAHSQTSSAPASTTSRLPPLRPRHASNWTAQRRPSGRIRGLSALSSRTYIYLLVLVERQSVDGSRNAFCDRVLSDGSDTFSVGWPGVKDLKTVGTQWDDGVRSYFCLGEGAA